MLIPEPPEDGRALDELGDERLDALVGLSLRVADTERGHEAGPVPPAGEEEVPDLGIEKDQARHVPLLGRPPFEAAKQSGCGRVPREEVEPGSDDECGQWLDGGEQAEQAWANVFERVDVVCRGAAGEGVEVLPLDGVEPEGAGQRVEHGLGGRDPACLEPLDVVDADGGQRGDLFAPQSLDTPATTRPESDVLWLDLGPP